jgi:hypothetical protein
MLLLSGQSMMFLLRVVAADRRGGGRRRPLASATPTVGEIEDAQAGLGPEAGPADATAGPADATPDTTVPADARTTDPGVRE